MSTAIDVSETYDRSSTQDSRWKRVYRREFQIVTNDKNIGARAVREALPVSIGNTYSTRGDIDLGSFCQNITVQCTAVDGKQWSATADYGPYDATTDPASPIERPLKVNWSWVVRERPLMTDSDEKLICNSAGDPFDPPAVVDDYYSVLTIQRCEMTNDPTLNRLYRYATNLDVFLGADPGTVRCFPIEAELSKDQDIGWFWTKTYRFEEDPEGWNKGVLDQGLNQFDTAGTKVIPILINGKEVTEPKNLDGHGRLNPVGADPVFLPFKKFKSLPFDVFNITLDMIPHN